MAGLLICITDMVNYLGIIMYINRSFGTTSLAFLKDYNVYLAKRAVCRILGNCVARKELITIEILFKLCSAFNFNDHLHVCMPALFLVAFFSFLRISNLVPYKMSEIADPQACHLTPANVHVKRFTVINIFPFMTLTNDYKSK